MKVQHFFDEETSTLTYIVWDEKTSDAVIIDPVLNFDLPSGKYHLTSVNQLTEFLESRHLKAHYIIETHAHADHISGSQALKDRIAGIQIVIGSEICKVQKTFKEIFNFESSFKTDGSQFDLLVKEGQTLSAGALDFKVIYNPGHTQACYSYLIDGHIFVGDGLFMPDFGVARCDFPEGSAELLYDSITQKLYTLPDETLVYTGHDYQPGGRELQFKTTIKKSKESNVHLSAQTSKEAFVKFRTERDAKLSVPKLLLPSIQVNINAGRLPQTEENGVAYLKLPIQKKD